MNIIDADCHVIETERTWEFLDEADLKYKPFTVAPTDPANGGKLFWVIDGKLRPRRQSVGANRAEHLKTTEAAREMVDINGRLAHMDELEVDVQVLYPTIYLTQISPKPEVERALNKSYNRWMADIWNQSNGRLRWVVVPPLFSMDATLEELQFGKENGACGVFMRGIEADRLLCDPYFFPMYEEASRLDMPICIHAGIGNPYMSDLLSQDNDLGSFMRNKVPGLGAFHSLITNDIPGRFPDLRVGFIEIRAQWVPYLIADIAPRFARKGREMPDDLLRDNRFFVACQTDDDIPYILQWAGEDNLLIGSDYGHADTSAELEALRNLKSKGDVDSRIIDNILSDNPQRLYAI